jgi:hypothetical protein
MISLDLTYVYINIRIDLFGCGSLIKKNERNKYKIFWLVSISDLRVLRGI